MSLSMKKPAKGTILIAEPFLGDPSFDRSVILLTEHHDDGSVGFVLNRPLDLKIRQVLDGFADYNEPIFYGGPVQQNNLFYLHNQGELIPESVEVYPGIYWGGKISAVKELIESELIDESEIKFFLGYSGWGKNQLDDEIKDKSWMVVKPKFDLFQSDPKTLWKDLLISLGGDYLLWANAPIDPILN